MIATQEVTADERVLRARDEPIASPTHIDLRAMQISTIFVRYYSSKTEPAGKMPRSNNDATTHRRACVRAVQVDVRRIARRPKVEHGTHVSRPRRNSPDNASIATMHHHHRRRRKHIFLLLSFFLRRRRPYLAQQAESPRRRVDERLRRRRELVGRRRRVLRRGCLIARIVTRHVVLISAEKANNQARKR